MNNYGFYKYTSVISYYYNSNMEPSTFKRHLESNLFFPPKENLAWFKRALAVEQHHLLDCVKMVDKYM